MEEEQNRSAQEQKPTFPEASQNEVSFPTVGEPQKKGGAKTFLIIGILILVGILGFVIFKSATGKSDSTSTEPTPFDNLTTSDNSTATTSPSPVATATPSTDKSKVTILVQNGTGITGEAAYLQTQLKRLGYTNIKAGNASLTDASTTQVMFSDKLDKGVVSEISQKLNSVYQNVSVKTSTTATTDVVVITGLRKGQTPKPSTTPVASPSASPSASPTATPQ